MNKQQAQEIIRNTFESSFDKNSFAGFIKNLLNRIDDAPFVYQGNYIPDAYKQYIKSLERIGKFSDGENNIDILIITLQKETSLERARTMQRNFVAWYLNGSRGGEMKDAALAAFISPDEEDWRFSLVKMDYKFDKTQTGKIKVKEEFTPARRWSFLVGANEKSHTAQSRLVNILANDEQAPILKEIENAFDIETVTKEFFLKYRDLFLRTKEELDQVVKKDLRIKADFESKGVDTVNFAKKLLGQIVFLYFLQKKGWFGTGRDAAWGDGSKHFLRELFKKTHGIYNNFFNDILEPLFYEALRVDRSHDDDYYSRFNCKIPFLNGGLFDPIGNYDWVHTDIYLPDKLFSNQNKTKEGDIGDGILDIFDRYNFTVKEDEPLEKEVAIDPELLGKAYEKFNAIRPDNYTEFKAALNSGKPGEENKFNKKFGVYYTPREIVHYMCQQSLINYLISELEGKASKEDIEILFHIGEHVTENEAQIFTTGKETKTYSHKLPASVRKNAALIDEKLEDITICDPAVGSGAFPVGMMSEIIRTRNVLSIFIQDNTRTPYDLKHRCIEHSLYGVDIDPGAVEIAKLRLWLSLIVDEEDMKNIKPLPNLDYKVVCGNSLLNVEKDLFNQQIFDNLEKLKQIHFSETNPTKKQEYKKQIDNLFIQVTNGHKEFDFEVYFSEVCHQKGGFDIVIANPPYIGEKGNKDLFRLIKNTKLGILYSQGKMDLFYYFFHLALNLAKHKGMISFITTNYYPTATSAATLRQEFKSKCEVKQLINFNELKIFESAAGQHNMITILLRQNHPNSHSIVYTCKTRREGPATPNILSNILGWLDNETDYYEIKQKDLFYGERNDMRIRGLQNIDVVLDKMVANNAPLKNICNVFEGIQTGSNEIFVFNGFPAFYNNLSFDEKKLIKQFYKNSDIYKYGCKKSTKYLLYFQNDIDLQKHPHIKVYLEKNYKILSSRAQIKRSKQPWYTLLWPRDPKMFEVRPKIITSYRPNSNSFYYTEDRFYSGTDTYYIINANDWSLKCILAFLNSSLAFLWFKNKGKLKGNILELTGDNIELFPIPPKNNNENISNNLTTIVDNMLYITNDADYLQNPAKQGQIKEYEKQIDQIVYKLYDLTPKEIEIVEGTNKESDKP